MSIEPEVIWRERIGRHEIVLEVIPYANGGGDVRLVRVGPRGGRTILRYVGGEQSAESVRQDIRREQRRDAMFLSTLDTYYPRKR